MSLTTLSVEKVLCVGFATRTTLIKGDSSQGYEEGQTKSWEIQKVKWGPPPLAPSLSLERGSFPSSFLHSHHSSSPWSLSSSLQDSKSVYVEGAEDGGQEEEG